jgi:hypothetical protein
LGFWIGRPADSYSHELLVAPYKQCSASGARQPNGLIANAGYSDGNSWGVFFLFFAGPGSFLFALVFLFAAIESCLPKFAYGIAPGVIRTRLDYLEVNGKILAIAGDGGVVTLRDFQVAIGVTSGLTQLNRRALDRRDFRTIY